MYVRQTKQFLKVRYKDTAYNLATSDVHGSQSTNTQEYLYIKLKYWAYELNQNAHNTDVPGD